MPDITLAEKSKRNMLIGKSWEYLHDNFHKFSEDNKIKIALELVKKNMPTILEGDGLKMSSTFVYMDKKASDEAKTGTNRITSELSSK